MKTIRGSRRRLTAFCDLDLVSMHTASPRIPYHMATTCGSPSGPTEATVAVRLRSRNTATSDGVMTIFARSFVPIPLPLPASVVAVTATCPGAVGESFISRTGYHSADVPLGAAPHTALTPAGARQVPDERSALELRRYLLVGEVEAA